ncbi:hypothetical protein BDB01DRAFT_857176 [Pilobolus umbonatus]|nr:hypothetical protein BDB01DRAFT_857176 [Pilobolus umbonatus]
MDKASDYESGDSRILQEALHPSAVLFTFLQSDFAKQWDFFKLISDKIGPIDGVQVNFVRLSDSEKAVTEGLTFKNRQYKAVPTSDGAPTQLTRVGIGRIPFRTPANTVDVEVQRRLNQEALCHKLKSSLEPYGCVCQIQKVMADGYFKEKYLCYLTVTSQQPKRMRSIDSL